MACDTPQQNLLYKVTIATMMNYARAMMHHVNLPIEITYYVWQTWAGIIYTQQLKVLTYDKAYASQDKHYWMKSCEKAHQQMTKANLYKAVLQDQVPHGADVIDSTWAMKQKTSGEFCA